MRERRRYVLFVFICAALLAVCTLVACNPENSGQETDETIFYTVTFDTQGGSQIATTEVKSGDILGKVDLPTKQCAVFEGFATDASGAEMWNLTTDKVDKAITLYAIWSDAHSWGDGRRQSPLLAWRTGKERVFVPCANVPKPKSYPLRTSGANGKSL